MGESPFSLAFGTEAVLLPEVVFPTSQVENFEENTSEQGLQENLNLIEEQKVKAQLRTLAYHKVVA
ncbi:hypothetical protein BHE74_00013252 [Ensete ventricosum]|nr:hypothetical protein GW17_00021806 [Ensete ventricosum]RWW78529.1 hypothetical protein BHE74_00013252 [Ensete ventricosum]